MAITSSQGGKTLLSVTDIELSNLHMQKILYMCHVFHVGRHQGAPLFDEPFEAWDYGPVLPSLYREIRFFGADPVEDIWSDLSIPKADTSEYAIIKEIGALLAKKTGGELVGITHHPQGAWEKNYQPGQRHIKIPLQDVEEEYKKIYAS